VTDLLTRLPRTAFLPRDTTGLCGVEIEFGGLTEDAAAEIARDTLGGTLARHSDHELALTDSKIGPLKIYLDSALRDRTDTALGRLGLDLSRAIVPVEIVTAPLTPGQMPRLDALCTALAAAGATGTGDGLLLGFGLHLNPEIERDDADHLWSILTAYALCEDWLRYDGGMDVARRVLPFSDPYPRGFLDELALGPPPDRGALFDLYLDWNPTRNRGLDLLPLIAELDPDRIARLDTATSARPTWHYRLPDCRIDEAEWSVAFEWNRWAMVERLAADRWRLERLCAAWTDYRADLTSLRPDWRDTVAHALAPLLPQ